MVGISNARGAGTNQAPPDIKVSIRELRFYYGKLEALKGITMDIRKNELLTIMGPSGSGKTTLLRSLNRLGDLIAGTSVSGQVLVDGKDIYGPGVDVAELRRRIGMVFALPVVLPMSIYDNVAYGPRKRGIKRRALLDEIVEQALRAAILWDEVKDRLRDHAGRLSGGQQQRLSIARVLAVQPEIIMLDEPTSGLDPISTLRIEELLHELVERYTVILVTHNPLQAARVGGDVAFFLLGELVERAPAGVIFTSPRDKRTEDYITGKFG
ncbi:MAG TPA: phosphate ABC transporter ATP-binding protein [Firmicutes bacterium]|nr:phosphate ABC transporter ATP-binding protein [Bacillota bacterium]